MISIIKEEFHAFVPAAIEPSDNVWNNMQSYIESAQQYINAEILGAIANQIENDDLLTTLAKRAICLAAFKNAIPSLDLILTANGFGITSTQNIAPASKERVDRLLTSIERDYHNAVDTLIVALHSDNTPEIGDAWRNTMGDRVIRHLVWRTEDFRNITGNITATRADLVKAYPYFEECNGTLAKHISRNYIIELRNKTIMRSLTIHDCVVVDYIKTFYGLAIAKQPTDHLITAIMNYIDANQEHFTTYFGSKEYAARQTKGYENKQNHPTFFFGG